MELGEVLNLTLQHLDRVILIDWLIVSLEISHLVHSTDDLLVGASVLIHIHDLWLLSCHIVKRSILRFVDNLDCGYVRIIIAIVLELDIVIEQEVHETTLLILRKLAEYERLWCRRIVCHLTLCKGRPASSLS